MKQCQKPVALIVEDECLIRMLAAEAFGDSGFRVFEAEDAAEAVSIYRANMEIGVVFTDVNMPGAFNGIDLAEQLRGITPGLEIIITSALPVLRPVDHIPATFVSKPYHAPTVANAARALLIA